MNESMKVADGHHGFTTCTDVEACLAVNGEDLVIRGGVKVPPRVERGNYADAWVDRIVLDHPSEPAWSGALTIEDEERAHDALFQAACDELARRDGR
jgi:hypothetical protein